MLNTRLFILENFCITAVNPNIAKAFSEAQVDTLIFIATLQTLRNSTLEVFDFGQNKEVLVKNKIQQIRFFSNEGFVLDVEVDEKTAQILRKIRNKSIHLGENFEITRGVNPYDKYRGQSPEVISSRLYHSGYKKDETFLPELKGKHVSSFQYSWDQKHYISYGNWLAAPREPRFFKGERLIFREILSERFVCALIEEDFITDRSLYIALPKHGNIDVWFTLGVLCSKLLIWLFKLEKNEFDKLFPKIRVEEFKKLPIPTNIDNGEIGKISKQITQLKSDMINTGELENQIDQLVYKLYDLTEEEIAIIENN